MYNGNGLLQVKERTLATCLIPEHPLSATARVTAYMVLGEMELRMRRQSLRWCTLSFFSRGTLTLNVLEVPCLT